MIYPQFCTTPEFTRRAGVTRWPSMVPRDERLRWHHSARSFSFPWRVPGETGRALDIHLKDISVVMEVLGGGLVLTHGTHHRTARRQSC